MGFSTSIFDVSSSDGRGMSSLATSLAHLQFFSGLSRLLEHKHDLHEINTRIGPIGKLRFRSVRKSAKFGPNLYAVALILRKLVNLFGSFKLKEDPSQRFQDENLF